MKKIRKIARKIIRAEAIELTDRLREELVRQREHRHYRAGRSLFTFDRYPTIFGVSFLRNYADGQEVDFAHALSDRQPPLFYAGFEKSNRFQEFVAGKGPDERIRIISMADEVLQNQFPMFSLGFLSFSHPPRWNYDPLSGKLAPEKFYATIDYLDPDSVGDSKVVWEISRFQFVFDLGQAYILTADERYSRKFFELIHSWSDYHRDYHGIAYCSALEFAFRIKSLLWAIFFFGKSAALTRESARVIYRLIYTSARFIEDHLSRYFAPNTHLLGEAWGLYITGLLFPEFEDAGRWLNLGRAILTAELDNQVTPDGMHAELSVAYHAYALEFILSATILSERVGMPLPQKFYDRLQQMTAVLSALQRPDGTWPNIGDQDGGRLHFLSRVVATDYRPLLEAASLFTGQTENPHRRGRYCDSFWLVGAEPGSTSERDIRDTKSQYLHSSGIQVSRSPKGMFSLLQCGRFGYKDSPHSHADMLHLDLSVGPDNYFVDPGTYVYASDLELRNDYRSERRHNGPAVEGIKLAHPTDPFAWLMKPDCFVTRCYLGTKVDYTTASCRLRQGLAGAAVISREVLFVHDCFWIIRDSIELDQPRALSWHFTTPCQVTHHGADVVLQGQESSLTVLSEFSSSDLSVHREVTEADLSEDYLHRRSGFALHFKTDPAPRAKATFLMIPQSAGINTPLECMITRNRERTVVSYFMDRDAFTISLGKDNSEMGKLQTDADLIVLVRSGEHLRSCVLINGSLVLSDGDTVFSSDASVRFAEVLRQDDQVTIQIAEEGASSLSLRERTVAIPLKNLAT
jgi:hypothetical protein